MNLQPGTELILFSSHIEDGPNSFFMHSGRNEFLKNIMLQLKATRLSMLEDIPVPGSLCAVKGSNNMVFRARVTSTSSHECHVLLIDFGKHMNIPIAALRQLPVNFQVYKPFSQRFCLINADRIPRDSFKLFSEVVKHQPLRVKVAKNMDKFCLCQVFIENIDVVDLVSKMSRDVLLYENLELSCDSEYKVVVCYVDSTKLPWSFYVQLADNAGKLEQLMRELAQVCNSLPSPSKATIAAGKPIVAKFQEDGEWYRATVLHNTATHTSVLYVDYGNNELIKHEDTRPIHSDLVTSLPSQAIMCRLQSADTIEAAATKFEQKCCGICIMRVIKLLDTGELLVKMFDACKVDISMELILGEASAAAPKPAIKSSATATKNELCNKLLPPIPDQVKPLRDVMFNTDPAWMKQANVTFDTPGLPEQRSDPNLRGPKFCTLVEALEEKVKQFENQRQKPAENWNDGNYSPRIHKHNASRKSTYDHGSNRYHSERSHKSSREADKEKWMHDKYYEHEQCFEDKPPHRSANTSWQRNMHHTKEIETHPSFVQFDGPPVVVVPKTQFKYTRLKISPGLKEMQVKQTYAKSPWHFSLQIIENGAKLRVMMDKIAQFVQSGGNTLLMSAHELQPGVACLAKHAGIWFRAQVADVLDDMTARLKLVDIGSMVEVNIHTHVRQATVELRQLEIQNFECTLRGAVPKNGDNWSSAEVEFFQHLTVNKTLQADLIGVDKHIYSVVLYDGNKCINSQFGATLHCLQARSTLAQLSLPLGSHHEAEICWFFTPSHFYLYLNSREQDRGTLWKRIESQVFNCPVLLQVNKGDLVLARVPQKPQHYRGVVVVTKEDKTKIFCFDRGDLQVCDASKLRAMPESLMDTPAYAVKCRLSNIVPVEDKWPRNMSQINSVFQYHHKFLVTLVSCDVTDTWSVNLTSLDRTYNVADELLKQGLAKTELQTGDRNLNAGSSCEAYIISVKGLELCDMNVMQNQLQHLTLCNGDTARCSQVAAKNSCVLAVDCRSGVNCIEALFVDYGSIDFKRLPGKPAQVPASVNKCHMAIKPPSNAITFSHEARHVLEQFVTEHANTCITVNVYNTCDDTLIVDVLGRQESVIDKLVSLKLAQRTYTQAVLCYVESASKFFVQEVSQEKMLQHIEERLVTSLKTLQRVEEGVLCVARYVEDEGLYRACIISVIETSVKVQFIDYGNTSLATELWELPEDLLSIPALAKQCMLQCVPTTQKDIDHFRSLDVSITYQLKLLQSQVQPWQVVLMKNGKNMCNVELNNDIQCVDVVISHYQAFHQLWVQRVSDQMQAEEIEVLLMELTTKPTDIPELGHICAAKSKGVWYRACIEHIYPPTAYFIDYGHSGEVSAFKELTPELRDIPALATMCSLQPVHLNYHQVANIQAELTRQNAVFLAQITQHAAKTYVNLYKNGKNILDIFPISAPQSSIKFTVSHFVCPKEFYIHLCSQQEKLEHLVSYVSNTEMFEDLFLPEQSMLCLAKNHNTGLWHRARVMSRTHTTQVFLIDYGLVLDTYELKVLPPAITKLPALATCCHLLNTPTSQTQLQQVSKILSDPSKPVFMTDTCEFMHVKSVGLNVYKNGINIVEQYHVPAAGCMQESMCSELCMLDIEEKSKVRNKQNHKNTCHDKFANAHVFEDMSMSSSDGDEASNVYHTASTSRSLCSTLNIGAHGLSMGSRHNHEEVKSARTLSRKSVLDRLIFSTNN